jgi:hypothetical protein
MWSAKFVLNLRIKPEETLKRLQSATRPLSHHHWPLWPRHDEQLEIQTRVKGNSFEIYCYPRNSDKSESEGTFSFYLGPIGYSISEKKVGLGPTFQGRVEPTEYGSVLRGSFRPSISVCVTLFLFFGILSAGVIVGYDLPIWLRGLIVLLLGGGAYWLSSVLARWSQGGEETVSLLRNTFAFATIREKQKGREDIHKW